MIAVGCQAVVNQQLAMRARRQSDSVQAAMQRSWDSSQVANRAAADSVERARVAAIPAHHWPPQIADLVRTKHVQLGMMPDMVLLSWGQPRRVNTTTTADVAEEQWVYESAYVYFRNGRVVAIQTSRD